MYDSDAPEMCDPSVECTVGLLYHRGNVARKREKVLLA